MIDKFKKMDHFGPALVPGPIDAGISAQFDVTITRNTSNIAQDLDVAVLGFTEVISGYAGIISPVVGGTLDVSGGIYNALPDRYRFTHTLGANTDTIDVTCSQHAYPSLLQSSGMDIYQITGVRYSVTQSSLADSQFGNKFKFAKQTIFGLDNKNSLSVISFKDPKNNQDNIIDIPVKMGMDKETCIALSIAANPTPASAIEVTLSFFVSFFDKYNVGKLQPMEIKR